MYRLIFCFALFLVSLLSHLARDNRQKLGFWLELAEFYRNVHKYVLSLSNKKVNKNK